MHTPRHYVPHYTGLFEVTVRDTKSGESVAMTIGTPANATARGVADLVAADLARHWPVETAKRRNGETSKHGNLGRQKRRRKLIADG